MRISPKIQKGFSLIEVMVAITLSSILLISVLHIVLISLQTTNNQARFVQGGYLASEALELTRFVRDQQWTNITSLTTGQPYHPQSQGSSWILASNAETISGGLFTRSVVVYDVYRDATTKDIVTSGGAIDPDTKKVVADVLWNAIGTGEQHITLEMYLTNWQ